MPPLRWSIGALVVSLLGLAPRTAHAQEIEPLAIVVNRSNPVTEISLADLRRVFRGQRSRWSNGRRVTLVMRDAGTPERDAILKSLYGVADEKEGGAAATHEHACSCDHCALTPSR